MMKVSVLTIASLTSVDSSADVLQC